MANFTVKIVERLTDPQAPAGYHVLNEALYGCERVSFSYDHGLTLHFDDKDTNAAHFSRAEEESSLIRVIYVMNEQGKTVDRYVL